MTVRRLSVTLLLAVALLLPRSSAALTEYRSDDDALSLHLSGYIKTLALGFNTSLPGAEDAAEDFTRARLMLEGSWGASGPLLTFLLPSHPWRSTGSIRREWMR